MWSETVKNYAPLELSFIHSKTLSLFPCNFPISQFKFLSDSNLCPPKSVPLKAGGTPAFIEAGEE